MTQHDPNDPDHVARAERNALAEAEIRKDVWRAWLATPGGERVVADLLRVSGYFDQSHTPGDPLHTAFREGQRAMGRAVYEALLTYAPAKWPAVAAVLVPPAEG